MDKLAIAFAGTFQRPKNVVCNVCFGLNLKARVGNILIQLGLIGRRAKIGVQKVTALSEDAVYGIEKGILARITM